MNESKQPPKWATKTKADEKAIRDGCYWDESRAQAIIDFAESVFQTQFSFTKFKLYDWQRCFLMSIEGWRLPSGHRRFSFANLHIAKKNGKTLLVAIVCTYFLYCSTDASPVIVAGAASKDNASQIFREIRHTIKNSDFADFTQITNNRKTIYVEELNATFFCVGSDGDRSHGENCLVAVLDECHAHKNDSLFNALSESICKRDHGIVILISTAGDDVSHWYYGMYQKSKRILNGEDLDLTHYAEIYEADPSRPLDEVEQWKRANPSPFSEEKFRLRMLAAKENVGTWLNFLRMRLNLWVRPEENAWLEMSHWVNYRRPFYDFVPSDVKGTVGIDYFTEDYLKQFPAWIGNDISTSLDPSSCSIIWHLGKGKFYCRSWAWVAKDSVAVREKTNLPRYQQFIEDGSMSSTEGNLIDDLAIFDHVLNLCGSYNVRQVGYDPASGGHILFGKIEREGYNIASFTTNFRNYNGTMKEFEKAYREGRIYHDGAGWQTYCLSNVRVEVNKQDEIRPIRAKSLDKIDGAVSLLIAFIEAVKDSVNEESAPLIGWI